MQVSVEHTGNLGRRVTVQVPAERVDEEVTSRLKNMQKTARVDGFRPGKVPFKVVQSKYGRPVREEVVQQVMQSTLDEALTREQLRPAGRPDIEFNGSPLETGPLEFVASFEVMPEIELQDIGGLQLEKPVAAVVDADVEAMLEKLRRQRADWVVVERAAASGDRVKIDFDGTIDGKPFQGNKASAVPLELGTHSMIDTFEEQLEGAATGETRTVTVTFPGDYHASNLAGNTAVFEVTVQEVAEARLPDLDDAFAAAYGVAEGGIERFRSEVRANMERELEQALKGAIKMQAFDQLMQVHTVEVPTTMVREEQERMQADAAASGQPGMASEDEARRRVALGLLINQVVRQHAIQLDPARVRQTVEQLASSYEQPQQVVDWYYESPDRLSGVQALVLEEQVVEWVLGLAKITEKQLSFEELIQSRKSG